MSFLRRLFGSEPPDDVRSEADDDAHAASAGDAMILEQLRRAGADLSLPREVIHYLYLPNETAAQTAADRLRPVGFTIEVRPIPGAPGPNPWLVQATIEQVLTDDAVATARRLFTQLAVATSGEYDGWEAAAKP
jgi:hypothetical protein